MTVVFLCMWIMGAPEPIVCLDAQACRVRAQITNNVSRQNVATCRPDNR